MATICTRAEDNEKQKVRSKKKDEGAIRKGNEQWERKKVLYFFSIFSMIQDYLRKGGHLSIFFIFLFQILLYLIYQTTIIIIPIVIPYNEYTYKFVITKQCCTSANDSFFSFSL